MIPHTEWERLALLKEIEQGIKVVIPSSEEHAHAMIRVAQLYLNQCYQETLDLLATGQKK
jgi:hypothetical protein